MGFVDFLSKRKLAKKRGYDQGLLGSRSPSSATNKKEVGNSNIHKDWPKGNSQEHNKMGKNKIDTFNNVLDQGYMTSPPTQSSVTLHNCHHQSSRHYDQPIQESNNDDDEMFNIICEVLPYFNQGDTNIDNIITDTIARLDYNALDKRDHDGNTLLLLACQNCAQVLVPILLSKGSDPNHQNFYGETCLHFTSYADSYSLDNAKLLVKYGANAEICEYRFGCTSLHYAASMGYTELCRVLLTGGASVSTLDKSGFDPLRYAMQSQNEKCIQILQNAHQQWLICNNSISTQEVVTDYESDWEQLVDEKCGMTFYHCRKTGKSLWESDYCAHRELKAKFSCTDRYISFDNAPLHHQEDDSIYYGNKSKQQHEEKTLQNNHTRVINNSLDRSKKEKEYDLQLYHNTDEILLETEDEERVHRSHHLSNESQFVHNTTSAGDSRKIQEQHLIESNLKSRSKDGSKDGSRDGSIPVKDSSNQTELLGIHFLGIDENIGKETNAIITTVMKDQVQTFLGNSDSLKRPTMVDAATGDADVQNAMWVSVDDYDAKEQELKQKHEHIIDLNHQIGQLQDTLNSKEILISSLQDTQRHNQQRIILMENEINEEKEVKADLLRHLEETQANISGIMNVSQSLDDEKRKHQSVVSRLQNELKESNEKYAADKESLILQVQSYEEQTIQQSMAISKLKDEMNTCISNNDNYLKKLEKEWEQQRQEIEIKHQNVVNEFKYKLDEQHKACITINMERDRAFKECEESKAIAAYAEDQLNKMKSMITEAKLLFRTNDDLHKSLHLEIEKRKELHNKLEDLKGKIRVYVRIRPLNGNELSKLCKEVLVKEDKRTCVMHLDSTSEYSEKVRSWEFDKIFSGDTNTQSHIFKDTKELVTSAVDGFNVCICCYGQTGSGKTYTMLGAMGSIPLVDNVTELSEDSGIAPRAAIELFEILDKRSSSFDTCVTVNMFELYKDNLRDLIAVSKDIEIQTLRIKLGEHTASGLVEVNGAQHVQVKNAMELLSIFHASSEVRSTACTKMNMESSRSHLIMIIVAKLTNKRTGAETNGKLTLVDLAGSERISKSGVSGTELKEAQSINKSLSALGDIINALTSGSKHVPYRNHPLTMLMSDSIGGRSKTLMFICCSPADYNASESSNSLEFAKRCKNVKNKGGTCASDDAAQLNALKIELARLKREKGTLNVTRTVKGPHNSRHGS